MSQEESTLRLALAFAKASATVREEALVPRGVLRAFEQELVYALRRHGHWRRTPLFKDALDDHLCREFGLPRAIVERLSSALLASPGVSPDDGPEIRPVPPTDEEFVRFVCVESATAQSEGQLARELGLGDQLFLRIKEAMRWLAQGRTETVRFATELDAKIAAVLCDLAKDLKTQPLALWAHKLRYLMTNVEAPWRDMLRDQGGQRFLAVLVSLGKRGEASVRQLAAKVQPAFPELSGADPVVLTAHLLESFERLSLVRPVTTRSAKDAGTVRWRLLPLGEEITAEAFARNYLNVGGELSLSAASLSALPAAYLAAIIRQIPADDSAAIQRLTREIRPLPSLAVAAILARVAELDGGEGATSFAQSLLLAEASPWSKAAACHALEQCATGLDVGQSLATMAESDASSVVRTAALRASLASLTSTKC